MFLLGLGVSLWGGLGLGGAPSVLLVAQGGLVKGGEESRGLQRSLEDSPQPGSPQPTRAAGTNPGGFPLPGSGAGGGGVPALAQAQDGPDPSTHPAPAWVLTPRAAAPSSCPTGGGPSTSNHGWGVPPGPHCPTPAWGGLRDPQGPPPTCSPRLELTTGPSCIPPHGAVGGHGHGLGLTQHSQGPHSPSPAQILVRNWTKIIK